MPARGVSPGLLPAHERQRPATMTERQSQGCGRDERMRDSPESSLRLLKTGKAV